MKKERTTALVGTALLGALVIVLDYAMKFSGWKIPFPWLPVLKFDFSGIPIVLALLLYGLRSGATTSAIAFLAILLRSGDLVGASMKALAEFSTILGMAPFVFRPSKAGRTLSFILALVDRAAVMSMFNLVVLPVFYPQTYSFPAAVVLIPMVVVFNVMAGCISIFGGYLIHKVIMRRISSATTQ